MYSGFTIQYNISNKLSIRGGLAFERKGTSFENSVTDNLGNNIGSIKHHSNFEYLTIPIMLRYTLGKKTKYFINAGSYLGSLVNQKEVNDDRPEFSRSVFSNFDSFKTLDIGLSSGIGASYPLGKKIRISAEFRNNLGLSYINNYTIYVGGSVRTNAFNLLLGLSYEISKKQKRTSS